MKKNKLVIPPNSKIYIEEINLPRLFGKASIFDVGQKSILPTMLFIAEMNERFKNLNKMLEIKEKK